MRVIGLAASDDPLKVRMRAYAFRLTKRLVCRSSDGLFVIKNDLRTVFEITELP
jgi:hypothetical protein